jgi:hypothetical protein
MELLLSWLVLSLAVWITAMILPGFHVKNFGSAILVAAIFGILNFLLGWLFFAVFTVLTLGIAWLLAFITRWIINDWRAGHVPGRHRPRVGHPQLRRVESRTLGIHLQSSFPSSSSGTHLSWKFHFAFDSIITVPEQSQ